MPELTLLPHHKKLIESSAIAPEVAAATGYWSATTPEELEAIGFAPYQRNVPALVVPIHDAAGAIVSHQIRPDQPRLTDAGRELKYETPAGSALALDCHPSTISQLGDPKVPIIITEGARKRDAAISHGLCAVSVLGVSGWRGRNNAGGIVALADWDRIALNGREVGIAFDSDLTSNNLVSMECERLLRFLARSGSSAGRGPCRRTRVFPRGEGARSPRGEYAADPSASSHPRAVGPGHLRVRALRSRGSPWMAVSSLLRSVRPDLRACVTAWCGGGRTGTR